MVIGLILLWPACGLTHVSEKNDAGIAIKFPAVWETRISALWRRELVTRLEHTIPELRRRYGISGSVRYNGPAFVDTTLPSSPDTDASELVLNPFGNGSELRSRAPKWTMNAARGFVPSDDDAAGSVRRPMASVWRRYV